MADVRDELTRAQQNQNDLQHQIDLASKNTERLKLANELTALQSAMSTDLAALRDRRESRKNSRGPQQDSGEPPAPSSETPGFKCTNCGEGFLMMGSLRLHESRCGVPLWKPPDPVHQCGSCGERFELQASLRVHEPRCSEQPADRPPNPTREGRTYHTPAPPSQARTPHGFGSGETLSPQQNSTIMIDTPLGKVVVPLGTDPLSAVAALRAQNTSPYSAATGSTFATPHPFSPSLHNTPSRLSSPSLRQPSPSPLAASQLSPCPSQPAIQIAGVLSLPRPWPASKLKPKPFWRSGVAVRSHPFHSKQSPLYTGSNMVAQIDTTTAWQCPNCRTSNKCEVDCAIADQQVLSFGLQNMAQDPAEPPRHTDVIRGLEIQEYKPFAAWRYHVRCTTCQWEDFCAGGGLASSV
eukprot:TRINITY_DN3832_c0_g2_i1.p1 TRINITY_DN3832_c0_g2~~TRINITY_DN3832_c0_g2_i1.p1  ORF type:complete len:409 (+),score=58.67 TRINITY_DN3832_c0_g2_i1:149-1375(+)